MGLHHTVFLILPPMCIAVCCSALQCVAVRCSALQCVAASCSVLQCVAACCSVFAVCLQCVCSELRTCVSYDSFPRISHLFSL